MVQNDWILDVLADLKEFALANDLETLAGQLDDTSLIAAVEITSKAEEAREQGNAGYCQSGPDIGGPRRHGHA